MLCLVAQFVGSEPLLSLKPELPRSAFARRALAQRLARTPSLPRLGRETLVALGRLAFDPLVAELRRSSGYRHDEVARLLARVAGPSDTRTIWSLYEPLDRVHGRSVFISSGDGSPLRKWLQDQADPSFVGRIYLPRFLRANELERSALLPFLLRSVDGPVVDALFAVLRDEKRPVWMRGRIYGTIAHCRRGDVLDWLTAARAGSRRLTAPNPAMREGEDSDGDGLPDGEDANPYVAPRALTDAEQAMKAAFEAHAHFGHAAGRTAYVGFPQGTAPFELAGWNGPILPTGRVPLPESPRVDEQGLFDHTWFGLASPPEGGSPVRLTDKGRTATLQLGAVSGPLAGAQYRFTLQKIRGIWFSVRQETLTVS